MFNTKYSAPHHKLFNATSSCNRPSLLIIAAGQEKAGCISFHKISHGQQLWPLTEPLFPISHTRGLVLFGFSPSGPGEHALEPLHGCERLTKCKSKYFYTWGMMGEINHGRTLWTSLLQQVPHGVNLPSTEVVLSFWDQNSPVNYCWFLICHWHRWRKINGNGMFKYANHLVSLIRSVMVWIPPQPFSFFTKPFP